MDEAAGVATNRQAIRALRGLERGSYNEPRPPGRGVPPLYRGGGLLQQMGGDSASIRPQLLDLGGLALSGLGPTVRQTAMDPRRRGQGVSGVLSGGVHGLGDLR